MNIEIFVRQVYGQTLIYPACDKAKKLAQFSGCRVFSGLQLALLKEIGITVTQVPDPRAQEVLG